MNESVLCVGGPLDGLAVIVKNIEEIIKVPIPKQVMDIEKPVEAQLELVYKPFELKGSSLTFVIYYLDGMTIDQVLAMILKRYLMGHLPLVKLKQISDAYDANELDGDAKKCYVFENCDAENETNHEDIVLYKIRRKRVLLTMADCDYAREALK